MEIIDRKKKEVEEKAKTSKRLSLQDIKILYGSYEDLVEEER
jgi:hypothetical protein